MELKTVSEKDNPLFARKEYVFEVRAGPTPSREKLLDAIAIAAKCPKECVVIDHVDQKFGTTKATVRAKAYSSGEAARKVERKFKFERTEKSGKKKAPAA